MRPQPAKGRKGLTTKTYGAGGNRTIRGEVRSQDGTRKATKKWGQR